ncbi:MAG: SulP family inorganic anion transporter [Flavobacteriaceae bacterium]|nr:SulP family inorganic anion transporter [Flavobacteriaceae bacterium]
MNKANPFKQFLGDLPKNIFSGFVVSLIALPLGLGLAIASEAPPIAGIIAAIAGGVVVSILGGSHLTITGPGNGLVIVILSAIVGMGEGDLYQGYLFTLAAIMLSGLLLFIFGIFRLGALSEFFPSTALQGMLAAIGVGILAKQFHVMLGFTDVKGNTISQLILIPNSIKNLLANPSNELILAACIGVLSLSFLFLYARIRNSVFQLIPAPMWVVIASIGVMYYYDLVLKTPEVLGSNLMITLPENLMASLPRPDFSKILSSEFMGYTLSITLVAVIESLLSIKAVDKLDPLKRRSNINKDLRALGIATGISGFFGGLNVVTVIARSSVNVNNGGNNRSANFFHAAFLVVFILLFAKQIQKIPMPALAAILVYTGYRLATPENLFRIYKIGKEQAIIFLTTLVATLLTSLTTGILLGILTTLLVHVFLNKSGVLFSRNWLKPNVLMYLEEETGNYYVSVKNFCTFLNFFKLKAKLDEIPPSEHAIIDFSLCEFVDHTVMEGLNDYSRSFSRQGGFFEIIGLDVHEAKTEHPFAIRKSLPESSFLNFEISLTKRQKLLQKLSTILDWEYLPDPVSNYADLEQFFYFKTKWINYRYNNLESKNKDFLLFDLSYSEGAFIAKEDLRSTFLQIKVHQKMPVFTLDKENFMTAILQLSGLQDIDFKKHPDFSKRFYLSGEDVKSIRSFFTDELIFFFESHPAYYLESNGDSILIRGKERLASIQEIKQMLAFAEELLKILENK